MDQSNSVSSARSMRAAEAKQRGEIVRQARHARGLSQKDLAQRCHCSPSQISRLETGDQLLTDVDRLRELATVLAIPPHLLGLTTEADSRRDPPLPRPRTATPANEVPAQLPMEAPGFVGRESELAQLDALIGPARKQPTTVVISAVFGTPAVGKTALALRWAHRIAHRFPDGQLYVNLRGFDQSGVATDPGEALREFLDGLCVDPQRIPDNLEGRTALYRSLLARRRTLVLLDNARDSEQVRPLLPGTPGCLVIVTSRNKLTGLVSKEGARPLILDLLSEAEAVRLLEHRLDEQQVVNEPHAVRDVVAACARLPLALAIAGARGATNPRLSVASLAGELRDNNARLDVLRGEGPDTDVRAVFSWSYRLLEPDAQRLFRLLGLYPGPDASVPAIASMTGMSPLRAQELLAVLSRSHLVAEQAQGRFGLHDLLRAYAVELLRAHDSAVQRHAAVRRMIDYHLHTAYAADRMLRPIREPIHLVSARYGITREELVDTGQALDWFRTERGALLTVLERAADLELDTHVWQLAWALDTFLDRQGYRHERVTTWQLALDATRRLRDRLAEGRAHRILGHAHTELQRFEDAQVHLRHALEALTDAGDRTGQGHTYAALGRLFERQKKYAEALGHTKAAMKLYREARYKWGEARMLNDIGWIQMRLGDHEQALNSCLQALTLNQQLGNSEAEAFTWDSLGSIHHQLGNRRHAVESYRRAVDIFQELGERAAVGASLDLLGEVHHVSDQISDALATWQRALEIFEDLDHPRAEALRAKIAGQHHYPPPPRVSDDE